MDINKLTRKDANLTAIMEQSAYWRKLEQKIKQQLPANLKEHYQVVCIEGNALVFYTENAMVAARLKMITPALLPNFQQLDRNIQKSIIRVKPQNPIKPKQKKAHLSSIAQDELQQTAEQLSHHPELAAALSRLGRKSH